MLERTFHVKEPSSLVLMSEALGEPEAVQIATIRPTQPTEDRHALD